MASVLRQKLTDLVSLAKPRITLLTLWTTFTGLWLAAGSTSLGSFPLIATLMGTGFGVMSSCMLNNYFDREIDRQMSRTRDRPLPSRRLPPQAALLPGVTFGVSGVFILAVFVNFLAAGLLLFSILNYAVIYTLWLKRQTPFSTEIVGLSGAMAPLIGWSAVHGAISYEILPLFFILFFWQPSHFWCLGILYCDDYKQAALPRYPVVHGIQKTRNRLLLYVLLLVPSSLSLGFLPSLGTKFLFGAGSLGILYLGMTFRYLKQEINRRNTLTLFFGSIAYLFFLLTFVLWFSMS